MRKRKELLSEGLMNMGVIMLVLGLFENVANVIMNDTRPMIVFVGIVLIMTAIGLTEKE